MTNQHAPVMCDVDFASYKRIKMEFPARDIDNLDALHGRYLQQVRERVYEKIRVGIFHRYNDRYPPFKAELWDQYKISVVPVLHFAVNQELRKQDEL